MTAFGWDIGLEVGQSARTVAECVDQAEKDITVITNMLEARLLTGDAELFRAMQDALTPDKVWPVKAFFRSEEHTSELQSLMRISYAVFCLKKKTSIRPTDNTAI